MSKKNPSKEKKKKEIMGRHLNSLISYLWFTFSENAYKVLWDNSGEYYSSVPNTCNKN